LHPRRGRAAVFWVSVVIRTPIRTRRTSTRAVRLPIAIPVAHEWFRGRWWGSQSAGAVPRRVPGPRLLSRGQCQCAGVNCARDRQTGHEADGFHCGSVPRAIGDDRRSAIASFAVCPGLAASPKRPLTPVRHAATSCDRYITYVHASHRVHGLEEYSVFRYTIHNDIMILSRVPP
jgi:hypothetical protein